MRLLVIGAVAAGTSAATRARRNDPDAEIIIYEKGEDISYAGCDTPYFLGGLIGDIKDLLPRGVNFFQEKHNIAIKLLHEVQAIDRAAQTLSVKNLESGENFIEHYDKLIIATGANAVLPPIKGADSDHVFSLRNIRDTVAIDNFISDKKPKTAAIIGSGSIGMELAENLQMRGLDISMIEMANEIHPALDPEFSEKIEAYLNENKVNTYKNTAASAIEKTYIVTADGRKISADLVIVATGIRPETRLAKAAGIKLGETSAISVDQNMRTNDPNIFAAGDCIETINLVTGKPGYFALGSTANKTGRIAGDVASGGNLSFPGVNGTGIFKVFDLSVGRTGLTETQAKAANLDYVVANINRPDKNRMAGGRDLFIKALAEKGSGRILGAQIIGYSGVDKRIDVLVTAMSLGAKASDLADLDLAYSPFHSTAKDPIMHVGTVLDKLLAQ